MAKYGELLNAPKPVQVMLFFGASLFLVVALVAIDGIVCSMIQDRYLRKHYFDQWALRRGSLSQRKSVVVPDDPFMRTLARHNRRVQHWVMVTWLVVLLLVSAAIVLR